MKTLCVFAGFVAGMVLTLTTAESARAACNASPTYFSMMFRQASEQDVKQLLSGRQHYRGRTGSIDAVHWVPGVTKHIVIQPDGCGSPGQITPAVAGAAVGAHDVALAVFSRRAKPGERAQRTVYATQEFCAAVGATKPGECLSGRLELLGGNAADNPFKVTASLAAAVEAAANSTPRGPVVVALVGANTTGKLQLSEIAEAIAGNAHGDVCASSPKERKGLYACIDRIYGDFPERCVYVLDEFACQTQEEPHLNRFAEQCEDVLPPPDDVCDNHPTEIVALVDDCGNLRVGFDWTRIEPADENHERWVDGRSGISPKLVKDGSIRIPGREFLGSTNPDLNQSDPRKPLIKVSDDVPHELRLYGTVDQSKSIIHLLPRFHVGKVCSSPPQYPEVEAALAVNQNESGGYEVDAGPIDHPDSAYEWNCVAIEPRYFACKGGPNEGMPCTRPAHCGPNGFCSGMPTCQRTDSVWEPGLGLTPDLRPCKTDAVCERDYGNQFPQCGYRLFDAKEKKGNNGEHFVRLKARPDNAGGERGVCTPNRVETCRKQSQCDSNECSGYRLHALHTDK